MDNEITMVRVFDTDIVAKEYQGRMVVTFKDIDDCHKRPEGTASRNFRKNREHFIENEDYFTISPDEFRRTIGDMDKRQNNYVILLTESGYLMTVKSLHDDLAWKVQRMLVNSYFRMKKLEEVAIEQHEQIEEKNQAIELYKSLILVLSDKDSIFYDNVRSIINNEVSKLNLPPTSPNQKALNTWKSTM